MASKARAVIMGMIPLVVLLTAARVAEASSYRCNPVKYNDGDHYAASVAYVLQDLKAVTPTRQGYVYNNKAPYYDAPCYGRGWCSPALQADGCAFCLNAAAKYVTNNCGKSVGAEGDLDQCSIRYEQYPF